MICLEKLFNKKVKKPITDKERDLANALVSHMINANQGATAKNTKDLNK